MPYTANHLSSIEAPHRADVDQLSGLTILEFGTTWCGHCRAAQAPLQAALEHQPEVRHLKIEDGPGQRLGRSFGVKWWPTLVLLRDGREVERLVRPTETASIAQALDRLATAGAPGPTT